MQSKYFIGYNMNHYRILLPPSKLRAMQRSFTSSAFLFPSYNVWGMDEVQYQKSFSLLLQVTWVVKKSCLADDNFYAQYFPLVKFLLSHSWRFGASAILKRLLISTSFLHSRPNCLFSSSCSSVSSSSSSSLIEFSFFCSAANAQVF